MISIFLKTCRVSVYHQIHFRWASRVAQLVKNTPAMYKTSTCNVEDPGLIFGLERSPGRGYGNPLQNCCLENPRGQGSLVGYSPWGHKESDTTEWLSIAHNLDTLLDWWLPGALSTVNCFSSRSTLLSCLSRHHILPVFLCSDSRLLHCLVLSLWPAGKRWYR